MKPVVKAFLILVALLPVLSPLIDAEEAVGARARAAPIENAASR